MEWAAHLVSDLGNHMRALPCTGGREFDDSWHRLVSTRFRAGLRGCTLLSKFARGVGGAGQNPVGHLRAASQQRFRECAK